ncbi:hypothetical protein QBC34DRAFT_311065 [Podospora aff. communis PSN243]|uniref:Heterokaryon incompatibility domain-containing protein n=1 Tax=Podospora aff. communis PSN243 TaxID=3040156 RepID=A0AAV9G5T6_9PEZI|nr:hypothetical protein QBC34DRAFT_311065 [Podospora aff. communis PSN243]
MRNIYTMCENVIVYLGDGKTHRPSRSLPAWLKEPIVFTGTGDQDDAHLATFWTALSIREAPLSNFHIFCLLRILGDVELAEVLLNSVNKSAIDATNFARVVERLRLMLLSPWWQRVWVIQELAVSTKAIIRYGPLQAPWDMLVAAASGAQRLQTISPSPGLENTKVLDYFSRLVNNFQRLRKQLQSDARGASLLALLQDFNARQASDERDKVYALLGLAFPSEAKRVSVLYFDEIEPSAVYIETAQALIETSGTFGLWAGDLGRKSRGDLPSWVPDWSTAFPEADLRRARVEGLYCACGAWKVEAPTPMYQERYRPHPVKGESGEEDTEVRDTVLGGMQRLLAFLEEGRGKRLPRSLKRILQGYRTRFRHGSRRFDEDDPEPESDTNTVAWVCEALAEHCTDDGQHWTSRTWMKRLFVGKMSTVLHGKPTRSKSFDWDGISWKHYFPALQYLLPTLRADSASKHILSVESLFAAQVSFVGEKLISWSDRKTAFSTIRSWMVSLDASHGSRREIPDAPALQLARTLVSDIIPAADSTPLDGTRPFRRLKEADDDDLLAWFRETILPMRGNDSWYPKRFMTSDHLAGFDEALMLATEGRALFETTDGRHGLGPGSMAEHDEIRIIPGGKTHIVLRKVSGQEFNVPFWAESRLYNVIGDCYLDGVGGVEVDVLETDDDGEVDEDGLRWPGGLPWELLFWRGSGPIVTGQASLLVHTRGERLFLV